MSRSDKRGNLANAVSLRGFVLRSAALSQKAALQMPFAATTPSREKVNRENPQIFPIYK